MQVVGDIAAGRLLELERLVAGCGTTEKVFAALQRHGLTFTDIIEQDEYDHDLLVSLPDGLWLVFDTT